MQTNDKTRMGSSQAYEKICLILGIIFFVAVWSTILGLAVTKLWDFLPWFVVAAALFWYVKSVKEAKKGETQNEQSK